MAACQTNVPDVYSAWDKGPGVSWGIPLTERASLSLKVVTFQADVKSEGARERKGC